AHRQTPFGKSLFAEGREARISLCDGLRASEQNISSDRRMDQQSSNHLVEWTVPLPWFGRRSLHIGRNDRAMIVADVAPQFAASVCNRGAIKHQSAPEAVAAIGGRIA